MRPFSPLALLILALNVPSAEGQEVTGALSGRLVDSSGDPVVDVTLIASGPALQGDRGGFSDARGEFHLPALPPGDYRVTVARLGFRTVVMEEVPVYLGRTTGLGEIQLEQAPVELEPLVITADQATIDPTSTTLGASLKAESYEALPTDRAFRSMVTLLPQANVSYLGDDANVLGSSGSDNVYFVDGINLTDPYLAVTEANLPYNFIKAIEVKEGGYEAEFGRALGGVVNVVTYSGGNEFSGRVFGFLTNSGLAASYRRGMLDARVEKSSTYDFGISLGGPIIPNRLWFFGAYDRTFEDQDLQVPGWGIQEDDRRSHLFAGKLTWAATQSTDLTLSVLGNPGRHHFIRIPAEGITSLENIDPILGYKEVGGLSSSLKIRSSLGRRLLLDGSVAHTTQDRILRGRTSTGINEPAFVDRTSGSRSGGFGSSEDVGSARTSISMSASLLLDRHRIKAGIGFEENTVDLQTKRTDPGKITKKSDTRYEVLVADRDFQVTNRVPSAFLQDSWMVTPWFRLNAGLRWDGQFLIGSEGDVAQPITGQFQPRIGFALQPGTPGRHKVFGSYGRFYQQIPLHASTLAHSLWENRMDYYSEDPRVPGVSADSVKVVQTTGDSYANPEVEDLRGEHLDEFVLGYELAFSGVFTAGVRGVYRTLREIYSSGFDYDSGPRGAFVGGNPGRGAMSFLPRPRREYSALEVTLERARSEGLDFAVSYVLSRNYGNYTGLYDSDGQYAGPGNNTSLQIVQQIPNSTGLLPNDRTHVLKVRGSRPFESGLTLGAFLTWMSGTPLNEFGPSPPFPPLRYTFLVKRGSAGRTPSVWDLNLRAIYDVPVRWSSWESPRLILDVLHIGSPRRALDVDQLHYPSAGFENPTYGEVRLYQPPMTVRLGFEVGLGSR